VTGTVRANLVAYPPLVYAVDSPRHTIGHIRVTQGIVGVDASGNNGGLNWGFIETGCLGTGVIIDGSLDFCKVDRIHQWPFGFSSDALYTSVYSDGVTRAAQFGEIDTLSIDTLQTFRASVHITGTSGGGGQENSIGSLMLDGDGSALYMDARKFNIGRLYKTRGVLAHLEPAIRMDGGELSVTEIDAVLGGAGKVIDINANNSICEINGGKIGLTTDEVAVLSTGVSKLSIDGVTFEAGTGVRTVDMITQNLNSVLVVTNCEFPSTGSGRVLVVNQDNDGIKIAGNDFYGYSFDANGKENGQYGPNRAPRFVWVPSVAFATVGDSVITPTFTNATFSMQADGYSFDIRIIFNTNAYTTASGDLRIGLPILPEGIDGASLTMGGFSKIVLPAGYTQVGAVIDEANNVLIFKRSGNGVGLATADTTSFPASTTGYEVLVSGRVRTI